MADRPILFSAPMVQALLGGRKTQTRRTLSRRWSIDGSPSGSFWNQLDWSTAEPRSTAMFMDVVLGPGNAPPDAHLRVRHADQESWHRVRPPYDIGDRLYVREQWQTHCDKDGITPRDLPPDTAVQHPATYDGWVSRRRPGIHMPRWASRLTLIVTNIHVQRLQDISEEDAKAEGCNEASQVHFAYLWEGINGPGSWAENPFVCAISFEVHKVNIDALKAEAA